MVIDYYKELDLDREAKKQVSSAKSMTNVLFQKSRATAEVIVVKPAELIERGVK